MALEVISQILSPTNATYINGVSAERRFSAAVLKNMYQGLVEKGGKGINDKFVSEDDAQSSAQVFVNRILPVKMQPREQGASKNGASFSANKHYTQTVTVGIELLQVLDDPIIIPRARQDMIKVDLLAEQTKIYSDRLATIINGATFACKVLKSWLADNPNLKVISSSDVSNKLVLNRFIEANSLLDEGDEANGIDLFPEDSRIAVFKPSYRATLKTSGVLVLGGANYAYDIAKGDAISHESSARRSEDGYIGDIDGVPCHIISNESLRHADGFLGFAEGELKASACLGYISSSYANARGVSTSKLTKVVDAIDGQGLILQPYCKFGVESWYPKGNVVLSSAEYNPFAFLKTAFSSSLSSIAFKLKGVGSRLVPSITITSAGATGATFTIKAEDDWGTGHVVAALTYVGATEAKTLAEFEAGYGSATYKGVVTITTGAASSVATTDLTVANNDWINCLAISSDGSVAVKGLKKTA